MKGGTLLVYMAVALARAGSLACATDPPGLWIDVPYVAQAKEGCGSATMAMVMRYWAKQNGKPESPEMDASKIQEQLYAPRLGGIPASAMEEYFQQHGYRTFAFRGEWADLANHLKKGRPLIVSLKANGAHGPLHYAVVVGLEEVRGYVFLNDPVRGKLLRMSREGFQTEWDSGKRWTLLVVPLGEN